MTITHVYRRAALALVASLAIGACSDTNIDSPGSGTPTSPPPPPPPPPAAASISFYPTAGDASSCPAGTVGETLTGGSTEACVLRGEITTDVTIPAGIKIALDGPVFVGQDGGISATLTLGAGSGVFGSSGADYLIITRGSRIEAVGTASSPVIMTSRTDAELLFDSVSGNERATDNTIVGEWGGLVINGLAPINACSSGSAVGGAADCNKSGEGSSGLFGGDQPGDDSGTLNYVVVKYAGFEVTTDNELNGIAFQGVGSGTDVDYVQVHNNADDGFEFFGGTVNAKHIVLTGNADDSLDWTDGWTGNVQYVIVHIVQGSDRGIEADNLDGSNDALPRSNPTISNFTFIGSGTVGKADSSGMVLRRGTAGRFVNGVVVNWLNAGVDIDSAATFTNAAATAGCSLVASNTDLGFGSIFLDNTENIESGDAGDTEAAVLAQCANIVQGSHTLSGFSFYASATNADPIGVVPGASEAALNAAAVDPSTINAFFDAATYVGAVNGASDDWYRVWTFQDAP